MNKHDVDDQDKKEKHGKRKRKKDGSMVCIGEWVNNEVLPPHVVLMVKALTGLQGRHHYFHHHPHPHTHALWKKMMTRRMTIKIVMVRVIKKVPLISCL